MQNLNSTYNLLQFNIYNVYANFHASKAVLKIRRAFFRRIHLFNETVVSKMNIEEGQSVWIRSGQCAGRYGKVTRVAGPGRTDKMQIRLDGSSDFIEVFKNHVSICSLANEKGEYSDTDSSSSDESISKVDANSDNEEDSGDEDGAGEVNDASNDAGSSNNTNNVNGAPNTNNGTTVAAGSGGAPKKRGRPNGSLGSGNGAQKTAKQPAVPSDPLKPHGREYVYEPNGITQDINGTERRPHVARINWGNLTGRGLGRMDDPQPIDYFFLATPMSYFGVIVEATAKDNTYFSDRGGFHLGHLLRYIGIKAAQRLNHKSGGNDAYWMGESAVNTCQDTANYLDKFDISRDEFKSIDCNLKLAKYTIAERTEVCSFYLVFIYNLQC